MELLSPWCVWLEISPSTFIHIFHIWKLSRRPNVKRTNIWKNLLIIVTCNQFSFSPNFIFCFHSMFMSFLLQHSFALYTLSFAKFSNNIYGILSNSHKHIYIFCTLYIWILIRPLLTDTEFTCWKFLTLRLVWDVLKISVLFWNVRTPFWSVLCDFPLRKRQTVELSSKAPKNSKYQSRKKNCG